MPSGPAASPAEHPPVEILEGLRAMGLLDAGIAAVGEALTGGVSSDIWRIDLPGHGPVCVKRALPKLKVAADWRAPVSRNLYEARWMLRAGAAAPGAVPRLLGQDEATGTLAMQWLPPADHALWKTRLRDGEADPGFAAEVAGRLVRIHAASAATPELAAEFPTDGIFRAIRLDPYLLATGRAHPDLAARMERLVAVTAATKRALVHGDVSPKNILAGPRGPVFLDAECAWWGDPAFDLAFCLNHLLLKCLWKPSARAGFLACFDALAAAYLAGVDWEPPAELEGRAARLLPGLFLARVDGKSPVEYLAEEADKDRVRRTARALLVEPVERLGAVRDAWREELER
jgi:aminoglycoside phosphotransferase (APT) family kinase protein